MSRVVKCILGLLDQSKSPSLDLSSSLSLPGQDYFATGQFPEGAPTRRVASSKDTTDNPSDRTSRRANSVGPHEQCNREVRNQDDSHPLSPPVSL